MVLIFNILQAILNSKSFTPRVPANVWIRWCHRFPPRDCCSRALEAQGNMLHDFAGWLTAKSWSCESCIHEFTGSPSWPGPSDVVENSSSNGWKSETELPRTPSFPMVSLMLHWVKCGQRMPKRLGHDRVPWPRAWPPKWWLYRMQLLKHYYSGNLGVTQLKSVAVFY